MKRQFMLQFGYRAVNHLCLCTLMMSCHPSVYRGLLTSCYILSHRYHHPSLHYRRHKLHCFDPIGQFCGNIRYMIKSLSFFDLKIFLFSKRPNCQTSMDSTLTGAFTFCDQFPHPLKTRLWWRICCDLAKSLFIGSLESGDLFCVGAFGRVLV
jgi:hypothetical protein